MANLSLRRYDTQAYLSAILAVASLVTLAGQAVLIFQNLDSSDFTIYYGPTRRLLVLAFTGLTMLVGFIAFSLGLNSAGQRRNDKGQLSWLGFFLSALVLCGAILLFAVFWMRGESVIMA